jgi:gluconolactonase
MSTIANDPAFERIASTSAQVRILADGFASAEGPVWFEERGCLVFSEVGIAPTADGFRRVNDGRRHCYDPGSGRCTLEHEPTHLTNGMTRDRHGRLLMCEYGSRRVTRLEPDGSSTVIASHYRGMRFSAPNDIVVRSDGSIYFTDTGGVQAGQEIDFSAVFRVAPDLGSINMVAHGFQLVNGLCFSPDEKILYVNDSQGVYADPDTFHSQGTIRAYDVRPSGMLANDRLLCELRGGDSGMPDGMKCDIEGNVYCTGPGGVWVMNPQGRHLGTILTDVRHNENDTTNVAWGGADWKTLYITTSSSLLAIDLGIPAVPLPAIA